MGSDGDRRADGDGTKITKATKITKNLLVFFVSL